MAKARKGTRKAAAKTGNLPTREQLVEFLADNPERNSKRSWCRYSAVCSPIHLTYTGTSIANLLR